MDYIEKIKNSRTGFNRRWAINSSENSELEFKKFKTRILNAIKGVDQKLQSEGIRLFCNVLGIKEAWKSDAYHQKWTKVVENEFSAVDDEKEFYYRLQLLVDLPFKKINKAYEIIDHKAVVLSHIRESVDLSGVNLAMTTDSAGDLIFLPKGEELLDETLVNEPLKFLTGSALEHFKQALVEFQNDKPVRSAEELRRTVEEFLKAILKNDRVLKNNILRVGSTLKSDNRAPQLRNIIQQNLNYLDAFWDDKSKHKDGDINANDNEFIIYQVGLLLRYLHKQL